MKTTRWLAAPAAATFAGLALLASTATADPGPALQLTTTSESQASCAASPVFAPLLTRFGDTRLYAVAPGAAFESRDGAGWRFGGGAGIVAGNERFYVRSPTDRSSLHLPAGATAMSPVMCVSLDYPTMRLFARSLDASGAADLNVSVYFPDHPDRKLEKVRTHNSNAGQSWVLTPDIDVKPDQMGSYDGYIRVAFLLDVKAERGKPGYRVDDLLVDPRAHR